MTVVRAAGLLSGVFVLLQSAGCVAYLARAEVEFRQKLPAAGMRELSVESRNGEIEVQCVPGAAEVDIAAVKYSRGLTHADALRHAEEISIDARRDSARPDALRVVAEWPRDADGRGRGARFRVTLPPDAVLKLRTSNGHVSVAGAGRDVDIETSNGRVSVRDAGAAVAARTRNGRVAVTNARGNVDVRSSNGGIELDRVGVDQVRAETSNGSVRVTGARGNADVRTSNGSIELQLVSVPPRPDITVSSSNGHVSVQAPATINARLRMRTSNGGVHLDLHDATPLRDVSTGRSHFDATLNNGSGIIELHTSNGAVTFRTIAG